VANFLEKTFYKYIERNYFYVERKWLNEKMDTLYNDLGKRNELGASVISIILTVFAIGTQYVYLDSPNKHTKGCSATTFSEDEVGNGFYQQALRLLPEIIESSSLESVQACLLFGVYILPIDASGLGYVYINLAIRLGMQNGMHRKCASGVFKPNMIETRNRVWWSAYMIERYDPCQNTVRLMVLSIVRKISIFHGRPLSVIRSDIDTDLPSDRHGVQWESSSSSTAYMLAAIQLIHRLEDFYNEMYEI
jgi:hypothetical protein